MTFEQYCTKAYVEARLLERTEALRIIRGMPPDDRRDYQHQVRSLGAKISVLEEQIAVIEASPSDKNSVKEAATWLGRCASRIAEGYYDQPAVDHLYDISDCIAPEVKALLPEAFAAFDRAVLHFTDTTETPAHTEIIVPDASIVSEPSRESLTTGGSTPNINEKDAIKGQIAAQFVNGAPVHIGAMVRAIWGHELPSGDFGQFRAMLHELVAEGRLHNWTRSRYALVPESTHRRDDNPVHSEAASSQLALEKRIRAAGIGTPVSRGGVSSVNHRTRRKGGNRKGR